MSEPALLIASAFVSAFVNVLGRFRPGAPRRILVVKVDNLGDAVMATPALRALRDAYPEAEIELLMTSSIAPLFEGSPLATRVRIYDSPRYRHGVGGPTPTLPAGSYDTVVELRGDWHTLVLPFRVGAVRRVDRGTALLRNWFARRFGREPLHEVEVNLAVVRPLLKSGSRMEHLRPEIRIPPDARGSLATRLATAGFQGDGPIVVVHPGAGWRPRAWFPERFVAIADWARTHYGAQVVYIGTAEERDIEVAIRSRARGSGIFLFGVLTLPEIAALLERSILLIGNDSGVVHLATACGTPVVALFGAQDPKRFHPWVDPNRAAVLHHRVSCCPCAQVRCVRPEMPCVNLIQVSEVQAAVHALLGSPPSHA